LVVGLARAVLRQVAVRREAEAQRARGAPPPPPRRARSPLADGARTTKTARRPQCASVLAINPEWRSAAQQHLSRTVD
jgi:hypothetical protein